MPQVFDEVSRHLINFAVVPAVYINLRVLKRNASIIIIINQSPNESANESNAFRRRHINMRLKITQCMTKDRLNKPMELKNGSFGQRTVSFEVDEQS